MSMTAVHAKDGISRTVRIQEVVEHDNDDVIDDDREEEEEVEKEEGRRRRRRRRRSSGESANLFINPNSWYLSHTFATH